MRVSCLQENLANGLEIVNRAVASRSTALPVLTNVLLRVEDGRLVLSATNLEIAIRTWVDAEIGQEGEICVPARTFAALVRMLPAERVEMELSQRTRTLRLCSGRREAYIKGMETAEFPQIPQLKTDDPVLIAPDVLLQTIRQVAFAAATDDIRLMLTGVLARFQGGRLTMAATDGFRLSVRNAALSAPVRAPFQVLVPARALLELARVSRGEQGPVEVVLSPSRGQLQFRLEHTHMVISLLDLQFPAFEQLIPRRCQTRTVLSRSELLGAGRFASIFASDGANVVRLRVIPGAAARPGRVRIAARSEETGNNLDEIDAAVEGEGIEIAFNVRYLTDVLSALDTPQVALETLNASSPALLKPVGDDDFVHLISPMHIGR
jgi:DNA polymerase III subunit beta